MGKQAAKRIAKVALEVHPSRFELTKLDKGYITSDAMTGLTWSHTLGSATHADAQKLVDQLNTDKHGSFADWRLPTVEELFLIADRSRSSPAIDTAAFPDTKSDWYWTSTSYTPLSDFAWFVYFNDGYSGYDYRGSRHYVRAVRASQSLGSRR